MWDFFDIKTDDRFTYGMRIELGKLLADEARSDVEKFVGTFECLYGKRPKARDYSRLLGRFETIVNDLIYWLESEQRLLSTTPTADELAAGYRDFATRVGELGTVVRLSKDYGVFPNEVLKRPYSEIFSILYTDCELGKYEKRYSDLLSKKYKHHGL